MLDKDLDEFAAENYPEIKEAMDDAMAKVDAFNKAMDKLHEEMYGKPPEESE